MGAVLACLGMDMLRGGLRSDHLPFALLAQKGGSGRLARL